MSLDELEKLTRTALKALNGVGSQRDELIYANYARAARPETVLKLTAVARAAKGLMTKFENPGNAAVWNTEPLRDALAALEEG